VKDEAESFFPDCPCEESCNSLMLPKRSFTAARAVDFKLFSSLLLSVPPIDVVESCDIVTLPILAPGILFFSLIFSNRARNDAAAPTDSAPRLATDVWPILADSKLDVERVDEGE
jgi:hypothetical protein